MTKISSNNKRLDWSTPELRRISAGSAENKDNKGRADGPSGGPTDKS